MHVRVLEIRRRSGFLHGVAREQFSEKLVLCACVCVRVCTASSQLVTRSPSALDYTRHKAHVALGHLDVGLLDAHIKALDSPEPCARVCASVKWAIQTVQIVEIAGNNIDNEDVYYTYVHSLANVHANNYSV